MVHCSFKIKRKLNDLSNYQSYFKFIRLLGILIFFNFISVLITSKLLLTARIHIPGIYWIPQTIAYYFVDNYGEEWSGKTWIALDLLIYYLGVCFLNCFFIVFAYYKINRRYAKYSALSVMIWVGLGLLLAIIEARTKNSSTDSFFNWFDSSNQFKLDGKNLDRTHEISFYLLAIIIGIFDGLVSSFIWKEKLCSGGLDFVFTYLSIKKRKQVNQAAMPISLLFAMIAILVNETGANHPDFNLGAFIFLTIASTILAYARLTVISVLYPKYKLITFLIVTTKGKEVRKNLLTFYRHGGNIIPVKGLYDDQDKVMIVTTMTYLEKDFLLQKLIKFDPKAFIIGVPSNFISTTFKYESE